MIGTLREVEACKKDGSSFPCILGISELKQNDGQKHYVGFIRDVTLQKSLLVSEAMRDASNNINDGILDACKKFMIFPHAFGLVYCILILNHIFSFQLLTRCLS